MKDPKPGSAEAFKQGCLCPRSENNYGSGQETIRPDCTIWIINTDCPIHGIIESVKTFTAVKN